MKKKKRVILSEKMIQATKTLIKRYEAVTEESLKSNSLSELTGFGSSSTCLLCNTADDLRNYGKFCSTCVHKTSNIGHCNTTDKEAYSRTFNFLKSSMISNNYYMIIIACRLRALYLKGILKDYQEKKCRTERQIIKMDKNVYEAL